MLKAIRYAGKAYQNEVAREVTALGYTIREARDEQRQVTGFEVEGLSEELCVRFAKRRAEIDREIVAFRQKNGREPTVIEISRITRDTRAVKLPEVTTPEVRDLQRAQMSPAERMSLEHLKARALASANTVPANEESQEVAALRAGVDHLFERQSVAPGHQILAEALNQALGSVDLGALKEIVRGGGSELFALSAESALFGEYATRRGLELERWSVAFVDATKASFLR